MQSRRSYCADLSTNATAHAVRPMKVMHSVIATS
eukprot:COSAG02_NODE_46500_length_348_cov_0.879518_1_plen_33_part_01